MFNSEYMDPDGETNKSIEGKKNKDSFSKGHFFNVLFILQSFWIRYSPIFTYTVDRKFMESQLCNVLYCGTIFWSLFILFEIVK